MNREKLKRGWVWNLTTNTPYNGHIQGGKRPWVVVSNDKCNEFSPTIHMAPVTSRHKRPYPTHVDILNDRGELNTVLLEQVEIFNVSDLKGEPRWRLKPSEILKVDAAISVQFSNQGNHLFEMDSYLTKCEEYLKSLLEEHNKSMAELDKSIEALKKKIDAKVEEKPKPVEPQEIKSVETPVVKPVNPKSAPPKRNPAESQVEKFNRKWGRQPVVSPVTPTVTVERRGIMQISWTLDNIKKFFRNLYDKDAKAVAEAWGISSSSIPAYKSKFLKTYKQSFTKEDKKKFLNDCKTLPLKQVAINWSIPSNKDVMKFRTEFEVEFE